MWDLTCFTYYNRNQLMQSWFMLSAAYCAQIWLVPFNCITKKVTPYCYHLVNVICLAWSQSDHIKWLPLYYDSLLFTMLKERGSTAWNATAQKTSRNFFWYCWNWVFKPSQKKPATYKIKNSIFIGFLLT